MLKALPLLLVLGCPQQELPPNLPMVAGVECKITQVQVPLDALYGWWKLTTRATYSDGSPAWQRFYSARQERRQALKDCDEWLTCVQRERERIRKEGK